MKKYILENKIIRQVYDLAEWSNWFEKANRQISVTKITDEIEVSTVFLGTDHSFGGSVPILFETMIFGGIHDGFQNRYATYEDAEKGHLNAVKMCKNNNYENKD